MHRTTQRPNYLFNDNDTFSLMESLKAKLSSEIIGLNAEQLLNTSIDDLCDYYIDRFTLDPPKIRKDDAVVDQSEIDIDISQDQMRYIRDRSRPHYIKGTLVIAEVPFDGDPDLFQFRASNYTHSPPTGVVKNGIIVISIQGTDLTSEGVQQHLTKTMDEIVRHLEWLSADCFGFNKSLSQTVRPMLEARRDKLLKDRNLLANVGFPLKARATEITTYAAPEVRRKVTPVLPTPSKEPFQPEPALLDDHYNHILKVLNDMVQVMERSPSAFAIMAEEQLRDHFLVQLNGHFEGSATGETFNFNGKTDILIRVKGKNIFIGECKFWRGPKAYLETLTQILGYASWRDTKVAVLVFNRNKDFSKVLEAIASETPKHTNYKRTIAEVSETETKFKFRHNDDENRELVLTVLAFEVPSSAVIQD